MGRYTGPKCRLCRREGEKLFLKGEKCYTPACPIERRNKIPGVARRPRKLSDYGLHLREKQKVMRIYRLREGQFRNYVNLAKRDKGVTGEVLLSILERRLDNVAYRAGLASSRDQARQMITHGHFSVNGRNMNIPAYLVSEGDELTVKENARGKSGVKQVLEANSKRKTPSWIERTDTGARMVEHPRVDELEHGIQLNLIVEYYSR